MTPLISTSNCELIMSQFGTILNIGENSILTIILRVIKDPKHKSFNIYCKALWFQVNMFLLGLI